jgi:hypothetical protein
MQSTNLESTSLNGLLSGKNLIAIGGGRPDEWEILQFLNSELISSGVFALTFRLRGLRGSDSTMPTLWPAGSHVVVIDAGLGQISLSVDQLNVEKNYRVGFYTEDIGSDLIQHYTNTARGSGFRPLSVGHLRCQVGAQGSHQFRWMRRSRFGGDSWDGFEVPLNEDREIYLLVVRSLDGGVLLREFLEKQEFTFTLDRRLEAGVVGLYSVEVSQVSSVYGIGPKTVCVVEYT